VDWIFDNMQIVVVIAAAIATLVTRSKQAREDRDAAENLPPAIPVDPDFELRRIREEVMRRRAEREGRPVPTPASSPQPEAPPPLLHDDTASDDDHPMRREENEWQPEQPRPVVVATAPPSVPMAHEEREEEVLERQRVLAEKLRELRAARDAASVTAKAFAVEASPLTTHPTPQSRLPGLPFHPATLAADLRRPSELRRAIVFSEILGRPKGA
jgi:type IV secretory pathway VirB10-like protein